MPGLTDRDIGQYYAILLNINLKVVTVDDRRLQHPNCPLRLVGEDARGNQFNIRAYSNNDERLEPVQINHIYTFSKLTVQMARQPFDVVGSPRCAFLIEKYCEMFSLNAQQDEAQLTDLESLVEDKSLWAATVSYVGYQDYDDFMRMNVRDQNGRIHSIELHQSPVYFKNILRANYIREEQIVTLSGVTLVPKYEDRYAQTLRNEDGAIITYNEHGVVREILKSPQNKIDEEAYRSLLL